MTTTNVPNHSQTSRIQHDIQTILRGQGDRVSYWQGNSYKSIPVTIHVDGHRIIHGIKLVHWNTPIAIITAVGAIYFDARYISSTTRGFQGRIVNAMRNVFGNDYASVARIVEELSLPTSERDVLDWLNDSTRIQTR